MKLDKQAYALHLASFREALHPRDPKGRFKEKLDAIWKVADARGVELWTSTPSTGPAEHEFGMVIDHIGTAQDKRGSGAASQTLQELTDVADEAGVPIALDIGDPDFIQEQGGKGLTKTQLTAWYKRYGFKPNKGKNKDFAFRHAMVRQPKVPSWMEPKRKTLKGFQGLTETGPVKGPWRGTEMYIGIDSQDPEQTAHDLASAYAENGDGTLYKVSYPAKSVLVLDDGEKLQQAWQMSGAEEGAQFWQSAAIFADWARARGYDSVWIDWDADDDLGYRWGAELWGEPQAILLDPSKTKLSVAKKK